MGFGLIKWLQVSVTPKSRPGTSAPLPLFGEDTALNHGTKMGLILTIILIIVLLGALPTWPYSAGWGYYPSGGAGVILVVVIVLLLMGRV